MQKTNGFMWVGILIAIVIATVSLLFRSAAPAPAPDESNQSFGSSVNGGNVTDYTAVNTTAGYWVNGTKVIGSSGILAASQAVFDAGILRSYTNSTSTTATSQTLVQADILNYDTMLITPNTGSLTLTLPASSTLTSVVPSAGDRQDICIVNGTSTAAITIKLAAGTGIDLYTVATSTISGAGGVLPIGPQVMGCVTFVRQADTDVSALYIPAINAD